MGPVSRSVPDPQVGVSRRADTQADPLRKGFPVHPGPRRSSFSGSAVKGRGGGGQGLFHPAQHILVGQLSQAFVGSALAFGGQAGNRSALETTQAVQLFVNGNKNPLKGFSHLPRIHAAEDAHRRNLQGRGQVEGPGVCGHQKVQLGDHGHQLPQVQLVDQVEQIRPGRREKIRRAAQDHHPGLKILDQFQGQLVPLEPVPGPLRPTHPRMKADQGASFRIEPGKQLSSLLFFLPAQKQFGVPGLKFKLGRVEIAFRKVQVGGRFIDQIDGPVRRDVRLQARSPVQVWIVFKYLGEVGLKINLRIRQEFPQDPDQGRGPDHIAQGHLAPYQNILPGPDPAFDGAGPWRKTASSAALVLPFAVLPLGQAILTPLHRLPVPSLRFRAAADQLRHLGRKPVRVQSPRRSDRRWPYAELRRCPGPRPRPGPPTSMEVRPTRLMEALSITKSPTKTGLRNLRLSMEAVTTLPRKCRRAATPAALSMSFMITPPWTLPAGLVSWGSISWLRITTVSSGVLPDIRSPPKMDLPA